MLARDAHGDLAVAASTSGWAWKYPGRVEMALRAATARSLVLYLKMGLLLWNAAREAMLALYAKEFHRHEKVPSSARCPLS